MKKSHFKTLLVVLAATLLLASTFTIFTFAGDKYSEVTFVENTSSFKQAVLKGEEMTIPEPKEESIGGEIYGWFDMEGNLYTPGQKFTPTSDLILYRAEGDEFALSASLPIYCQKGYTYVKLKSSITLDSPITLPEGKILYIDLNGNTINLSTSASVDETTDEEIPVGAFVGQNSGVILANSSSNKATVNHTAAGSTDFLVNSLISVAPTDSPKNLTFVIKENVTVNSNMNFLSVTSDISEFPNSLNVSIYGELNAARIFRSSGLENASVKIYESAKVSISSEYMLEDIIPTDNNVATLTIYGGEISLIAGFIRNQARVTPLIYGGFYSRDISSLIPNGNFVFELNSNGLYEFKGCSHSGPLAENVISCDDDCEKIHDHCVCTTGHVHCNGENCTNTDPSHVHCKCTLDHKHCQCISLFNHSSHFHCDTPRKLTHRCNYCGQEYTVYYQNGVGHSLKMELVQSPINTPEETQAARYKTYCTRGDFERLEYAFPDPSSVYVTVKYTEKDEVSGALTVKEIRVPSLDIYSFDETLKTKILSFSVDSVYTTDENGEKKNIDPSSIFYVEVPLGTTDLYGELKNANNTPTKVGVFVNDYYIKEISLPISLVNIDNYAFFNMNSIEKITGIEYVTGSIGKEAFMQSAKTKLIFDYLELNASSVGESAFHNIIITNSLTIGTNVTKISNNAFALDPEVVVTNENRIKEIFIVGNETYDGVTLSVAKSNMGSGHQFSNLPIVYTGHQYLKTTIPATCISYGYDLNKCSRCFAEYNDNYVYVYTDHAFVEHIVASTCQQYGFEGTRCTVCDLKVKAKDLPIDKNNHTYAAGVVKYAIKEGGSFCVDPYYTLRQCGCGRIEPSTESTIKFTFTGNTEETVWNFYILEDGNVLIYKNGQRITSKSSASLVIENGAIKTLTANGVTFNMIKESGGSEADTLSGTYTAFYNANINFTVEVSAGTRINAVIPPPTADHTYKETFLIEPTCVEGKVRRVCTECKYTPPDTIVKPIQEHSREKIVMQEATCSQVESGVYKCTVCGGESPYKFEGKFDNTKHTKKDGDEGVVVAEPSSEHAGIRRFQCKDCGGDVFEEIPKIDESFSFTIPILNITINTDKRTFKTTLIIIFASIPLVAGIFLTFFFTFTKKKSKSAGYKFRFNTLKKGAGGSNKTVAEQLAEMNLVDELPPDVAVDETGKRDDEAAWTAYVDAINNDYTRTMEMNLEKQESSEDEVKPDMANAWDAYVEALSKDYEETVELSLNKENSEEKSLAELMNDTVVDMSVSPFTAEESSEDAQVDDDESFTI